jgi:hypothetical protein
LDDRDKSVSFVGGATPRRPTLSVDEIMSPTSILAWDVVATFFDVASAHAMAVLLRDEGVPAEVFSESSLLGQARQCEVRVPAELARRARWLMSQSQFTDAELTFLATGELDGTDNAE